MKRAFLALVVICSAALGTVTVNGQRGLPACDPDNGGLKLPQGFCALIVATDVGTARQCLLRDGSSKAVSTTDDGQLF